MKEFRRFWIALAVLAALAPLGLYLPKIMKAGAAWGEWGIGEIREMIGYVPAGMERDAGRWNAPMPDYAPPGQENAPFRRQGVWYMVSAVIGVAVCGAGGYLLGRWMSRRKR